MGQRIDGQRHGLDANIRKAYSLLSLLDPDLLDQVPIAIAVAFDPLAAGVRVNRHFAGLLGVETHANASLSASTPPEYRVMQGERVVAADDLPLQRSARTNAVVSDWRADVIRPDGVRAAIVAHAIPLRDESGAVIGSFGIFLDSSALHRAEEQLSDAEIRFRHVFDAMSDAFAALDREFRFIYVNDRCARLARKRRDDLLGRAIWDVFPESPQLQAFQGLRRVIAEQRPVVVEEYYPPLDIWFEARLYPTPDGLACFATDITGRKRLEAEREQHVADARRLAAIVESSDDPIIGKDLNGIVTSWNPAAERLFGYAAGEIVGRSIRMIIPTDRLGEEDDVLSRIRRGERIEHFETVRKAKDGRLVEVALTLSPIRTVDGRIIGASKMVRDLTPLRAYAIELERQVGERTADLQEANARLETFAFSVAHDLRAPLRGMHGLSQALLEDYGDRLDDVGRDYARRIVQEAIAMDKLIQDLLAYGRLAHVELAITAVELREVADSALHVVEREASERGAVIDVDAQLPAVTGNQSVLVQVFTNLLSNAIKFGGPHPRVRVWSETHADGMAHVWVEDQGIGIAPEHHERIFAVFERLHGVEEYPGTGIGLAIVRKGIERLGGRVGVESAEGRGSRFWIELPQVSAA